MKKLKEYLPFLIGCKIHVEKQWIYDTDGIIETAVKEPFVTLTAGHLYKAEQNLIAFKPILKPLANLTERNRFELEVYTNRAFKNMQGEDTDVQQAAIVVKWYLENSFDVFDLITKNMAIDATANPQPKPKLTYEKD